MKIRKIEYSNFRNFKEKGSIEFSTDGRVTIIYGKNGDGKTTLHQLFQWILYNEVHFNKTATDKMYNLEFENNFEYGKTFSVIGSIDFEHAGSEYSARREYVYKKGLDSSEKIKEEFSIRKKGEDDDWGEKLAKPDEFIKELLPPGLSQYFFFDGESMIADLSTKGQDSAHKLKQSLYTMFDLNAFQQASEHIGSTDLKTTVLGKLFIDLGAGVDSGEVAAVKTNIDSAQNQIQKYKDDKEKYSKEKSEKKKFIQEVSEKIGSTQSKAEYERQRKAKIKERDMLLEEISDTQVQFGDYAAETFPKLLIAKKMKDAKGKIRLKIEQEKLMPGVNRILIDALIGSENEDKMCICGRPLYDEQLKRLQAYYKLLPPDSYKGLYDNFTKMAELWGEKYNRKVIEKYIQTILNKREAAAQCDSEIKRIEEAEKEGKGLQQLIEDRHTAEERVEKLETIITECDVNLNKYSMYLKKQMKKYEELTSTSDNYQKYLDLIEIMEKVKNYFAEQLEIKSQEYSAKLAVEIQNLINQMLTSKRTVTVTSDFLVTVADSLGNESKSEGQFAVVSFAFIGGILNMLSKETALTNKEYPLVLDGPFSKLDADQRQNVIDTIPAYAPQVIVFSKDDLRDYFKESQVGRVWTIKSNEEKNVAFVQEGYQWKK